jgi:hypothetical protein
MNKVSSLRDLPQTMAYLDRVGAEPRSLRAAVVKQVSGKYWRDLAVIKFSKSGEIDCSTTEHAPTETEQSLIATEFAGAQWPELKRLHSIINPPKAIAEAPLEAVFEFRDRSGQIIMLQVRQELDGDKRYVPWTYWDDDQWRSCEPDGPLPLFGLDGIKDNTTVFIHEGAKAARRMRWMVEGETAAAREALAAHPWGRELSHAAHVGWIGGAMSPYRTDWSVLQAAGIKRAYVVADNDDPGRKAVPSISYHLRVPTFMIQFTNEWPECFDLADDFPAKMFGGAGGDGSSHYVGPSFRDCLHPATWATDLVQQGKGRPAAKLRENFKEMWAYVEEADLFVCTEMPEILRSEAVLNKMLSGFSHVNDTTRLLVKAFSGRSARICYRPDSKGLMVTFKGSSAINLHVPSSIRAAPGDPRPWLDFLEYMFVNESERKAVMKWCATLIARPEVRMGYGLLLVSERQGIGKTTLGANILAPLVGPNNVGFPGENDILGSFNDWMANKRLVIVNEIYSGASWKAYHSLKSVITDRDLTVNQKYMRQYQIDNWCHVVACSNSMRALKMENDDRRWFYPEVTEVPWPNSRFSELRRWVDNGGLQIIRHWAESHGEYVRPGDRAPMTERKKEMIEGSRSDAQREAAALAEVLKDKKEPRALMIKDVVGWVRASTQGRVFDSDYELRKVMQDVGVRCWPRRIKVAGRLQHAVVNDALWDALSRAEGDEDLAEIRAHKVAPAELMEHEI